MEIVMLVRESNRQAFCSVQFALNGKDVKDVTGNQL
jgi:hypothetical protein